MPPRPARPVLAAALMACAVAGAWVGGGSAHAQTVACLDECDRNSPPCVQWTETGHGKADDGTLCQEDYDQACAAICEEEAERWRQPERPPSLAEQREQAVALLCEVDATGALEKVPGDLLDRVSAFCSMYRKAPP